jgi:DNA-binding NtrC family response regulator
MENANRRRVEIESLDGGSLAAQLCRPGARLFELRGVGDEHVYALLPRLREELEARGALALTLDPLGALATARTFTEVIEQYVAEVERRESVSERVGELIEWLHASRSEPAPARSGGQGALTDTLCQLWRTLSDQLPAVLVVFHPDELNEQVLGQLGYLARYYFSDPIEALSPEFGALEEARGALLVVSPTAQREELMGAGAVHVLDATEHIERSVREFLSRDDVVRRMVETTRGDLRRLDEAVEELRGGVPLLLARRFEGLPEAQRVLLRVLAVAGEPLELELAQEAARELAPEVAFIPTLKALTSGGLIARVVQMGALRVGVSDPEFARTIREGLGEEAARVHGALVDAALRSDEAPSMAVFLTRHALSAGRADVALERGQRAARALFKEARLEEAAGLIEGLLGREPGEVLRCELLAMQVDVHARMGMWRRAIRWCAELEGCVAGARGEAEHSLRMASLLKRVNRFEEVVERADAVVARFEEGEGSDDLLARAWAEKAEASYKLGEAGQGAGHAEKALELLGEREGVAAIEAARVQASNLLGSVRIFEARYDEATALFEANLEVARRWGWEVEAATATLNLGVVMMQRGRYDEARGFIEGALAQARYSTDIIRAHCHVNLAVIAQYEQDYEGALRNYLEALRVSRQTENDNVYASSAYNLVTLYSSMGAFERANALVEHLHDEGAPARTGFVSRWAELVEAKIRLEQGRYDEALSMLTDQASAASLGERVLYGPRTHALCLVQAHLGVGSWERARELFDGLEEGTGDPQQQALERSVEASLRLNEGDAEGAQSLAAAAARSWERVGNHMEAVRARLTWMRALEAQGRREQAAALAEETIREALAHSERVPDGLRDGFLAAPAHSELARLSSRLGVRAPRTFGGEAARGGGVEREGEEWSRWRQGYAGIVGQSPKLHHIFRVIDRVATSDATVLVLGESGTGKELIAEAIHTHSDRSSGPIVKVNCAAFVESLLLSELFGHEKGAFTGAAGRKLGRFELAHGGTIFLDEIADISPQTQVALLRVLQERRFERVGGTESIDVDVRVVCATNKNLEELVERGEFRLDLYYRLKGIVIELPALRDRREDIPLLAEAFARKAAGDDAPMFSRRAMERLVSYAWPGNVRELQNLVRNILLFVEGGVVEMHHVEEFTDFFSRDLFDVGAARPIVERWWSGEDMAAARAESVTVEVPALSASAAAPLVDPEEALVEQIVREGMSISEIKKRLEHECIRRALEQTEGNVTQAAKILKMTRPRLSQIISKTPELTELKDELVS